MEHLDGTSALIHTVPDKIQASALELKTLISSATGMVVDFGLKFIAAVLVLVGGMWLAKRLSGAFKRVLVRRELDPSFVSFMSSFVNILLRIFVIIISLATVGVQMTSIVAVLGAASLAIGMALSGTMQNFAGGILIMFLKPFKVGDVIEVASGKVGVVKKIMIFNTEVHTLDNQVVLLPNGALANGQIVNMTNNGTRRTDLTIDISYGDSVDIARKEILAILDGEKRVLKKPEPVVFVNDLAASSVQLVVRYWTHTGDVADCRGVILEEIYKRLPKKKIHFPFPQMDVYVK